MVGKRRFFIVPVILTGIFLFPLISFSANNLDVVINEVSWMGTSISANSEWLELYNNTSSDLDLSSWLLTALDGTPNITLTGTIKAHDYFLLERTSDESLPQIIADQIYSGALGNSGEVLELRDSQNNLIDSVDGLSGWPSGDNTDKKTMSRIDSLTISQIDNWQNSNEIGGTPKAANNIIKIVVDIPTSTPKVINKSDLVINEFVSDPKENSEWIELYNNTSSTISLIDFSLEDGLGQVATLSGEISAHGFLVVELSSSKLNNDGDKIILKYQNQIIDEVSYGNWPDGNLSDNAPVASNPNSIARKTDGYDSDIDSDDFSLTLTPTKNNVNLITLPQSPEPRPAPPSNPTSLGAYPLVNLSFQKSDVVINEFVSDPADGEVEWIELYNNTAGDVDLNKWWIEEGSGKKTELSGLINAHQFKVFENPKGNLNNSGDLIILKDPNSKIIDQVAYGSFDDGNKFDNTPLASDPDSVARVIDGYSTGINYNDFKITTVLTKGRPNIIDDDAKTTTTALIIKEDYSTTTYEFVSIIITEFLPNPMGSDMSEEFIEIYNPSDKEVDLTNWVLDDTDGGSRSYKIKGLIINPHEYLSFFRKDTGLALNNDIDNVRLITPLGVVSSEVEYKKIKEGLAYALDKNNKWQFTSSPTPGEENEIELEKIESTSTNSQNKTSRVTGTVLVEPGILGSQIFYIQDENIQVYSYKKDFPKLSVGDVVEVVGEISEGTGDRRIKIKNKDNIRIISHKNELLPSEVSLSDIDDSHQGQLVKVSGEVIEIKGSYIFIDDGTSEARIYLKASTDINKSLFKEGEKIELVGIVSKSGSDYRILPRYDTDILIIGDVKGEQEENIKSADNYQKYYIAVIIFMGLIISGLLFKQYSYKLK